MVKNIFILLLSFTTSLCFAQEEQVRKEHFNLNRDNVALDGYDPVSYFNGTPLEGKKEISYTYKGISYWFTTYTNRSKFKKSPSDYEPQYGGWCAYAFGQKLEKVGVDHETYKITDGKLYLFYNFYFTNTVKAWNKNETNFILIANKNWKSIITK